jgi:hypothetical protein
MPIVERTVYVAFGKYHGSREAAIDAHLDRLGEFLDPALGLWTPGEKLKLVKFLADNRKTITHFLEF